MVVEEVEVLGEENVGRVKKREGFFGTSVSGGYTLDGDSSWVEVNGGWGMGEGAKDGGKGLLKYCDFGGDKGSDRDKMSR